MYSNDKITQSIADSVRKVMEEELKGKQHKIDANKNDKIDAHDFELLRKKKKVEEKVVNPYAVGMAAAMKATGDKPPLKKSTIVKAHDIAKKVDEEVEQIDELSNDKLAAYSKAAKASRASLNKKWDQGKASQRDKEKVINHEKGEDHAYKTMRNRKEMEEDIQLSFTDLIESYKTGGLKSFFENFEVDVVEEEATSDEFVAELEKAKRKAAGKEKNEVAKAAVQAVQQEEVEQIDESDRSHIARPYNDFESKHYNDGADHGSEHALDSGFKHTARAGKKRMLADNPHKKGTQEHKDWHRGALDGHSEALDNM